MRNIKILFNIVLMIVASLAPGAVLAQCDVTDGMLIELQSTTAIDGLLRGSSGCVVGTTVDAPLTFSGGVLTLGQNGATTGQVLSWNGSAWVATTAILTEVDGSVTNEGSLTVGAGGANTSTIVSNTSGSTDVTVSGSNTILVTEAGSTITLQADTSLLATVNDVRHLDDSTFVKLSGSYAGKRITDNVYRYGTTGFRTDDTTGILNIASYDQKKAISILNPDTSNTWIFSMANPYSNRPTWNHTAYWGGNGSSGADPYPNLVFRLGSNVGTSNNQVISGAPSFFDQWETNWWGTGVLGEAALRNIYERHWVVIDSADVQHRPLTGYFEKKAGGRGELAAYVTRFMINDWNFDQNARLSVNKNSETELATANFYNDSLYTIDTAAIGTMAAAFFAASGKDNGGSVLGKGSGIVIGGKGSFTAYSSILAEYNSTNPNANMDLIFTTQGNNSTGVQRKRMWIKPGASTTIGINNANPAQALDIAGSLLVRGSQRINMRADSAALTLKYQSTGITAPALEWEFTNGTQAMYAHLYPYNSTNSTTNCNVVFGKTGTIHTLAAKNVVFGTTSAKFPTGIVGNSLFGYLAGNELNGGYNNVFLGTQTGEKNTTGYQNTFIGYFAGNLNTIGFQNMFLGRRAGSTNLSGSRNAAIGTDALRLNSTGDDNVAIGGQAGDAITGSNNTVIGASAGRLVTGSGNVLIGRQAAETQTSISNLLYIDNSNTTTPLLAGDFSANKAGVNVAPGSLGAAWHVTGTGTTSSTYSGIFEKSDGTDVLVIRDDGKVAIANDGFNEALNINGQARADAYDIRSWETTDNTNDGELHYEDGDGQTAYLTIGAGERRFPILPHMVQLQAIDYNVDWTTGRTKAFWTVPARFNGWKVSKVYVSVSSIGSVTGNVVEIEKGGVGITTQTISSASHTVTIDNSIATDDIFTFDITSIGATASKGLFVEIELRHN